MDPIILMNASILNTRDGSVLHDKHILIKNGYITKISDNFPEAQDPAVLDLKGKFVVPGFCDAHVHVTAVTADLAALTHWSPSYVIAKSIPIMEDMLMRGFTTVRDAGGADWGIIEAVNEGLINGPRILYCGKALSQTGGHGDGRKPGDHSSIPCYCNAALGRVSDGVSEVRKAAREEIRKGACHIKIMASGGVVSPTDRIDSVQYSSEEIQAIVEEAEAANIYVIAHTYTARAINHALNNGVRSIEHGNLLDESNIPAFLDNKAFLVPTLVTYQALVEEGVDSGLQKEYLDKLDIVLDAGIKALKLAHRSGIKMAYGTDLLGLMHRRQLEEFQIRAKVIPALAVIQAATINAAELFRMEGQIGEIIEGGYADLLVFRNNPVENIDILQSPQEELLVIMKEGNIVKNIL